MFVFKLRRVRDRDRTAGPQTLPLDHRGAEPVLAQHGWIGGRRLDHGARLEEIGRIEAERDPAPEIDAPKIDERAVINAPIDKPLAKIVAKVALMRKRFTV